MYLYRPEKASYTDQHWLRTCVWRLLRLASNKNKNKNKNKKKIKKKIKKIIIIIYTKANNCQILLKCSWLV